MKIIIIIILLTQLFSVSPRDRIYSPELLSTAYYQCLKAQTGYDRLITGLDYEDGVVDEDDLQNTINALSAGLQVEVVIGPSRCRPIDQEVEFIRSINQGLTSKFWIFAGQVTSSCDWTKFSPEQNCQYLNELASKLTTRLGYEIGILTEYETWTSIFGELTGCPEVSTYPLWWFQLAELERHQPNFDSYKQIGGWKVPFMKLYKGMKICGNVLVDSYYV